MYEELLATISGSFRFKDQIDEVHTTFSTNGVRVLSPDYGTIWVYRNGLLQANRLPFTPLLSESGMLIRQIEDTHLAAITRSDLLYVVAKDGYIGQSTALEMSRAITSDVPIVTSEPIRVDHDEWDWYRDIINQLVVRPPQEAIEIAYELKRARPYDRHIIYQRARVA